MLLLICNRELLFIGKRAVSYTHLDVYKRQTFGMPIGASHVRTKMKQIIKKEGLPDVVFHSLRHTSVSYTHLDVYKRQNPFFDSSHVFGTDKTYQFFVGIFGKKDGITSDHLYQSHQDQKGDRQDEFLQYLLSDP